MDLHTLQYRADKGWLSPFPAMDSAKTLIIVFAAPEFIDNQAPFKELCAHYPQAKIIGCSSAGEISGANIFDKSISVAIAKFNKTELKVVKTEIKHSEESFAAGQKIAQELDKNDLRSIFALSDGLQVNGSELVKGLNTLGKEEVVITGGLAGDGTNFQRTWALFNGEICTNIIVSVGFYGKAIKIGHASQGGWDIFGPERRVTRAKNNVLYELDGKPALALYKEYLGDRAAGLPATGLLFPLAIRSDASDSRQLVRTILAVNEKEQSMTFAGDIPTGWLAQLMRANLDRLITSAGAAGELATKRMHHDIEETNTSSVLAIAISCVGRRLLLGERTEEETETLLETLPSGAKQIGFYSYGELSPYTTGRCDLHNQTMTLTTLYETEEVD